MSYILTFLGVFVISLALGIMLFKDLFNYDSFWNVDNCLFFILFLVFSLTPPHVVCGSIFIFVLSEGTDKAPYDVDIVSLVGSDSIEGSFFLGSGSINGSSVYYYYTHTNGYLQLHSANALRTPLKYGKDAHVTITTKRCFWVYCNNLNRVKYIEVPEGTVKKNFDVVTNPE